MKLPLIGPYSYVIKRKIDQLLKKYYPQTNLRIILVNPMTSGNLFKFKDRLTTLVCSKVVYKYSCRQCSASYIGKTQRNLYTRICEHKGISERTGLPNNNMDKTSKIREHAETCNHPILQDDFKIISRVQFDSDLLLVESHAIKHFKPTLNDQNQSIDLNFI